MLKEKLETLDLKLIELSDLLDISRPTLYKFISLYDSKDVQNLSVRVKEIFDFVDKEAKSKKDVMLFVWKKESFNVENFNDFVSQHFTKQKSEFIKLVAKSDFLDFAFAYFVECGRLLDKANLGLNENEKEFLDAFFDFKHKIKRTHNEANPNF